jgi:hypothetical protein
VYGFGERKTPKPFVAACDKFVYTENLIEAPAAVAAVDAVGAPDAGGAAPKQRQRSDFDPRTYGYAELSDLIVATTLFDLDRRDMGTGRHHSLYARDKRRRPDRRPTAETDGTN